jgi:hypothetical protein
LDERSYLNKSLSEFTIGSLVRIMLFSGSYDEVPNYCLGIIISVENEKQTSLFPSAMIYNLETNQINREFISSLKVISNANGCA